MSGNWWQEQIQAYLKLVEVFDNTRINEAVDDKQLHLYSQIYYKGTDEIEWIHERCIQNNVKRLLDVN